MRLSLLIALVFSFVFVSAQRLELLGSLSGIENDKVELLSSDIGNGFPFIAIENSYEYLLHITKKEWLPGFELAAIYMPINGNYTVEIARVVISENNTILLSNNNESKRIALPLRNGDLYIVITTDDIQNKESVTSLSLSAVSFEQAKRDSRISIKTILPQNKFWQFTEDVQLLLHTQGKQGENFVMGNVLVRSVDQRVIKEEHIPKKYIYSLQNNKLGILAPNDRQNIFLEIYDINGIKVWEQQYNFSTTGFQIISLSNLKKGMYVVKMISGTETYFEKVIL